HGRTDFHRERQRPGHYGLHCAAVYKQFERSCDMMTQSRPRELTPAHYSSSFAPRSARADKIRVLIADDHAIVTAGLASIIGLQTDMIVIAEGANGREAADLWRRYQPDVALLDLRMPILDGVGALAEIHKEDPAAKIIMLTTYDTDNEIYRA